MLTQSLNKLRTRLGATVTVAVFFAALVLTVAGAPAFAVESTAADELGTASGLRAAGAQEVIVPDLSRVGSVSVTMQDPETLAPVGGGALTLFRVADVHVENDADYSFALTDEFAGSEESLVNLADADLPDRLASYAQKMEAAGVVRVIDRTGVACFDGLRPGLYLLVQHQAADGYYAIAPFLVSVPLEEGGAYVYDVNATPKMELLSQAPPEPDEPLLAKLVQTGDRAFLAVAGLAVVSLVAVVVALAARAVRCRKA